MRKELTKKQFMNRHNNKNEETFLNILKHVLYYPCRDGGRGEPGAPNFEKKKKKKIVY
jgi:hypothetical protein